MDYLVTGVITLEVMMADSDLVTGVITLERMMADSDC